jgi:uncharacterized membrane protein YgdD (TMEM256/DUF423 family)
MHRKIYLAGSILGALALLLGAFGGHLLKTKLSASDLEIYTMAVQYQFIHALALLIAGLFYKHYQHTVFINAFYLFFYGSLLFCFSLYGYVISSLSSSGKKEVWFSYFTPVGGVCLFLGWCCFVFYFAKNRNRRGGKTSARDEQNM